MSELSHFCFVSVFLRGTDLQIKQEASHRDAESGDGLALSVNLVETFRNKFHERQGTYEFLRPGSPRPASFATCFLVPWTLSANRRRYGGLFRAMLVKHG